MGIDEIVARARERIARVEPEAAAAEMSSGAIVIDLRCAEDRVLTGVIPGSVAVARSVLEWRCDPTSDWSDPEVARPDARVILVCSDGYSSSLAADSLREIGFVRVGDIVGGMRAWIEAGLPVEAAAD